MALILFVNHFFFGRTTRKSCHHGYSAWWRSWISLALSNEEMCVLDNIPISILALVLHLLGATECDGIFMIFPLLCKCVLCYWVVYVIL